MQFSNIFALALLAPLAAAVSVGSPRTGPASELLSRQLSDTCRENYGDYPVYTGGNNQDNKCGADAVDCTKLAARYCVPYPSFACPPQGYTCSST
ncbi:hypothetical protein CF327_g3394 [Tilletia walkeri]|uniref:Uncharacterized protein n=1 Tax=Tilletia walkeri TaxID=117179 RepID=A0A8X7NGH9_9BASI|nr:hypothetical protein CF327_g3394 [Tilletia walkeri]KAE8231497.1 hypothetical protein CF326_g3487 [Tilletia indica]KAE8271521.1 hypothetical protein A4X09_0g801 [Tilletia walkeri]